MPDPLERQIPLIVAALEAFGITIVGADHYEADDVIGTLATDAGMPVDIVTGDRDLFQLVDDDAEVRVLYIARGVSKHERIDQRRRSARSTASTPPSTPRSRPCAATPPTGCPGWPVSVTRPAAVLLNRFGDLRRDHRGGQGPRRRHGTGAPRQDQGRPGLPRGRP